MRRHTLVFDHTPSLTDAGRGLPMRIRRNPGEAVLSPSVNGQKVGRAHSDVLGKFFSSVDETIDIGHDVSQASASANACCGTISRVTIYLLGNRQADASPVPA